MPPTLAFRRAFLWPRIAGNGGGDALEIVVATEAELPAIIALDPLAGEGSRRRQFLADAVAARRCTVARLDGRVAGFAVLDRSFFDQWFVSLLFVAEQHRRQRVGTGLMQHAEGSCAGQKLFTSTNESNLRMQRLCERLGFRRSGYIENLDEGDPEIIYVKQL